MRDYILTSYPARVKDSFARGSLRLREYLTVKRQALAVYFRGKSATVSLHLQPRHPYRDRCSARLHEDKASFVFESKASCQRSRFHK